MKKSKFSEKQILSILKEPEHGKTVAEYPPLPNHILRAFISALTFAQNKGWVNTQAEMFGEVENWLRSGETKASFLGAGNLGATTAQQQNNIYYRKYNAGCF